MVGRGSWGRGGSDRAQGGVRSRTKSRRVRILMGGRVGVRVGIRFRVRVGVQVGVRARVGPQVPPVSLYPTTSGRTMTTG